MPTLIRSFGRKPVLLLTREDLRMISEGADLEASDTEGTVYVRLGEPEEMPEAQPR